MEGLDVEIVSADVHDLSSLCRAFEGAELVYHAAAHISISMDEWKRLAAVNILGTHNLIEACFQTGVRRLVHFSSVDALVRQPLDTPLDESRPLVKSRQYLPYARSKAAGERLVRQALDRWLDCRDPVPVGDHRPERLSHGLSERRSAGHQSQPAAGPDKRWVRLGPCPRCDRGCTSSCSARAGWRAVHPLRTLGLAARPGSPGGGDLWLPSTAVHGAPVVGSYCVPFAKMLSPLTGGLPLVTAPALKTLTGSQIISHERRASWATHLARCVRPWWIRYNGSETMGCWPNVAVWPPAARRSLLLRLFRPFAAG